MAKDPAFLFYPGDWMTGTMVLSRHLKGCYMDLLIAQFNNGPLSLESIKAVLGIDQANWTVLSKKFKQDSSGNYYNERLATEIEKRKNYCESKSHPNSGRKKSVDKSYDFHMDNHTENRNKNKDFKEDEEKGVGKGEEGFFLNEISMDLELTNVEVNAVKSYIDAVLQKKITDEEVKNYWTAFKIDNFKKHEWKKSHEDLISHFRRALENKLNNKKNGSKINATSNKPGTSEARVNALKNWSIGGKVSNSD